MKYIEKAWEEYRRMVLPASVSEVQLTETRKAFYAGASILFSLITIHAGTEDEEKDVAFLNALSAEVDTFGEELDHVVLGVSGIRGGKA